mmetsp:Transcript_574/g.1819  ORF Transcript_574/g.1819 Transcript_574/m.1819 type:complete len:876 (+) Transcript_574:412-3039(+)
MPCVFRIDYRVESISRDFGTVHFGPDNTNVNLMMVQAGWAKVRPPGGPGGASPQVDELLSAMEQAESDGVGLFTKEPGASEASIRNIPQGFDAMALLEAVGKGKPIPAIVEQLNSGSNLKVVLLSDLTNVGVQVAGIQCPAMPKRQPPPAAKDAAPAGEGASGVDSEGVPLHAPAGSAAARLASSAAAGAPAPGQPAPHAREALHFAECRVLHREVRVVLEGVDKFQNLFGSIYYPEDGQPVDLGEQLLKQGLAKVVEWSAAMMNQASAQKLRNAEREAKQARIRLWKDYVPPPTNSIAIVGDEFVGPVIEIVSGDLLMVLGPDGVERRVSLSSIRAPRMGNARREMKAEPYALEAKEFLRSRLVGSKVSVHMEYNRKIAGDGGERLVPCGSVYIEEKGEGGVPVKKNVAEMLVMRGLVGVVRHRGEEERSLHYEALLAAEEKAKKGKKGLHSAKDPPVHHINDVSQGAGAKARQFLPFLQRNGKNAALCEYVLSGHRFKIHVVKESATISFALSGVRAPPREDPVHSEAAIALMRGLVLQRDCEIEVETIDKMGTFIGTLWLVKAGGQRVNLAAKLLEAGLGKLDGRFDPSVAVDGPELEAAQEAAKGKKLKLWEGYDPAAVAAAAAAVSQAEDTPSEVMEVSVTEILGGGACYLQRNATEVEQLCAQLAGLSPSGPPPDGLRAGQQCLGKFTGDDTWYRAKVERVAPEGGMYDVFYVDFGNREQLPGSRVRPMEPEVAAVPPQAALCQMAYLHVPALDEECGYEAAECMAAMTTGGVMMCRVESRESAGPKGGQVLHVTLFEQGAETSVNATLLQEGLARITGRRGARGKAATNIKALEDHQEVAKKERKGIWRYGDVDSDEDEPPKAWGGGR